MRSIISIASRIAVPAVMTLSIIRISPASGCPTISPHTKWNEDLLAQENIHRGDYIQALKQADNGDYELLIKLQGNLVGG
jgi:hypothetical protein